MCQTETGGCGLNQGLTSGKGFEIVGNDLYLMKQQGPDSPFKNIPILGMIL